MKTESLTSFRRTFLQSLITACLISSYSIAVAQSAQNYCEPSLEVKEELEKVSRIADEDLYYRQMRERQTTMMQDLLRKYPDDFHVRKRYQSDRLYGWDIDKDALVAEYLEQMEKRKNDPASVYFYARMLVGGKTREAIEHLEKLVQQSPDFPWSYLVLAQIYNYRNFRDVARSKENLRIWKEKCPSLIDGFSLMLGAGDVELMSESARWLRIRLESSKSGEDLNYWENLWRLEFKIRPVPEHPQVRRQIVEDVERLRAMNLNSTRWLRTLHTGYKMADDREGMRRVEDEMLHLFPKLGITRSLIHSRWREEHPLPKPDDPPEKRQAYYHALLRITDEWIKQWPDDWSVWSSRLAAVGELDNTAGSEVEAAGESFLKAMELHEGGVYMVPPAAVQVAQVYAKRGIGTERIPSLVRKGLEEAERREKRNEVSDLYPQEDAYSDLKYVQRISRPILAEAYAKLKQSEKAREVLAQMFEALKLDEPDEKSNNLAKLNYANDQVNYWRTTAKVAEAEGRKLDAWMSYQTALSFRPKSAAPRPGRKDELADDAERLWKELGGTSEGRQAYLARNESSKTVTEIAEAATWDSKNQPLSDFALMDLQGRKWQLADLKGKVAFINLWATWCGPCRLELPYVQKLHEQMKENKDVLILTLNIDDEPGLIEPYVKENKFTFTVILGLDYTRSLGIHSIPRNWVVNTDGVLRFEERGFSGDGNEWMKKATEMIREARGSVEAGKPDGAK